jgi:hypothetical protein
VRLFRRRRFAPHVVLIVLRGERAGIHSLAARADRSLRTLAARQCAASAYDFVQLARITSTDRAIDQFMRSRPAWTRLGDQQFACAFGGRRSVLTVRPETAVEDLAAMLARTEVRVLLGDADSDFVTHLQTFAARELQRLLAGAR